MLVVNIKNSATCFGSLSNHQAKHSTGIFSECTLLCFVFGLMMAQ